MFESHGETDVGRRRDHNEDTIFVGDRVFVVCDGMGGHQAGEVASKMATDSIAEFVARSQEDPDLTWPFGYDPEMSGDGNRLTNGIKLANRTVFRSSTSTDEHRGMGTTVVAVIVSPSRPEVTYGHVGDSRIYLIRGDTMVQLTKDDSWASLAGDEDEDASPMKNVLTKALGIREEVDFPVVTREVAPGDTLLLCSDGLSNMMSDEAILDVVMANDDLGEACRQLVAGANAGGGRDNVSALLVRYRD